MQCCILLVLGWRLGCACGAKPSILLGTAPSVAAHAVGWLVGRSRLAGAVHLARNTSWFGQLVSPAALNV
eukprot:4537023-Alexandrium_andersonii.AAC.1